MFSYKFAKTFILEDDGCVLAYFSLLKDNDGTIPKNPSPEFSNINGWANSQPYITNVDWDTYVDDTWDPTYNNLKMVASTGAQSIKITGVDKDGETDNPYKASAIRLCMSRNRDEDGDGKIGEGELKWYLPASLQLDFISLCHLSFYDPLLDFNGLFDKYVVTDSWGNEYVVPLEAMVNDPKGYDLERHKSSFGAYTYITSDFKKVATHEMINTKAYDFNSTYTARPIEMRCVRNLGSPAEHQPGKIYKYNSDTKRFIMKNLDDRSVRSEKVVNKELEPNTNYSMGNRVYKGFQVAKNYVTINKSSWPDSKIVLHEALTSEDNPCRTYSSTDDGEVGSWRVPNLTELALMMFEDIGKKDKDRILPMSPSNNGVFACNTAWSFTPSEVVWGRAFLTKKDGSDWSSTLTDPRYSVVWKETYTTNNLAIRCVKDVDPTPVELVD